MGLGSRACAYAHIHLLLLMFLCVCFCGSLVNSAALKYGYSYPFSLNLIHYNDFHARYEETTHSLPVCNTNDTTCIGGFARLYQEVQSLLRERPDSIVLNAGDVFQGTYWYTLLKWEVTQKFINLLPNDVHALGNHEFDDGVAGLAPYLASLKAPVVAANIETVDEPSLKGLYLPHVILMRKGRKIGVIGLITNTTSESSNPEGVKFLDPIATAKKEALELTQKGVDIIVVLSHCGLDVDKQIAQEVGDNIDIIVGGHTHSLLWNHDNPPESASGPYPIIEKSKNNGNKVVIVTASAYAKFLGNLSVYFNEKGEVIKVRGEPVYLNRSIPEDPLINAIMAPYMDMLHKKVNEVVGYSDVEMTEQSCGGGECVLGDFFADALLNMTKQTIQTDLPHIAMVSRNMIRGSIPRGNVTKGAVINALPYTNKFGTGPVKGIDLLQGFEISLKTYWRKKPFMGPLIPQVSGLRVTLNTTSQKVVEVLVNDNFEWKPLDPDKEYQLTTAMFLWKGGNGFEMFKKYRTKATYVGVDSEIFEKYLKLSPKIPSIENRLVLVE